MTKPQTITQVAQMGGKARWQGVSKADRSEAMRRAVQARWKRKPDTIKNENG
jgi:hypothetical protein